MSSKKLISLSIIGKPNAGKSSLLNKLIGQKISIVTPKVQTTRTTITGIVTIDDTQVIVLDTPGIFEPKRALEKSMVKCAWSSIHGVDLILLLIDCTKPLDDFSIKTLKRLKALNLPIIFILNKIDLENTKSLSLKPYSLPRSGIEEYLKIEFPDCKILLLSALTGKGIDKLISYIKSSARSSEWLYDEDDITNLPMRFLAAEITREQLFLDLHQELPYNLTVDTESWQENPDTSVTIHQVIIVSKQSYKAMVLGKKGQRIKDIGSKARSKIQETFDLKVHLFLFVKVRPNFIDYINFNN